jgi:hypothetical protein
MPEEITPPWFKLFERIALAKLVQVVWIVPAFASKSSLAQWSAIVATIRVTSTGSLYTST